jgi:hypothetical protein
MPAVLAFPMLALSRNAQMFMKHRMGNMKISCLTRTVTDQQDPALVLLTSAFLLGGVGGSIVCDLGAQLELLGFGFGVHRREHLERDGRFDGHVVATVVAVD